MPAIMRYANAKGITDFKYGFVPYYLVKDELLPAYPLGDLTEPLLRKAVEHITGVTMTAIKRAKVPFTYEIYGHGYSPFNQFKRNLFIDKPPELFRSINHQ